jgi:pimeloyl-ACP methyl ester carboxylesterase
VNPRLIYLHGFASSPASSKARELARRFADEGITLEVPDLARGDFERLTVTGQLEVVEQLAGGQPVQLIGSSLGGYVAALYAARHPETDRVVLLAPAFQFAKRWRQWIGEEQLSRWASNRYLEFFHYGLGANQRLHYRFLEDAEAYEDFPSMPQPCLILHGRLDEVVPWELSRKFVSYNPMSRLEILESDHQLLDVLDQVWERVRGFLLLAKQARES